MDFKTAAILGSYISKDYAEDLFRLLATYRSISSSEAASRLGLHIKTVQDFMEAMTELGILSKEEVYEKKRPYYRYSLLKKRIIMDIDLGPYLNAQPPENKILTMIREYQNSGARFSTSRDGQYISNVAIWEGTGRERKERRINLSIPQGKFLFHLPFPSAEFMSIPEIMNKAGVSDMHKSEIMDIVNELIKLRVIESYE